MKTHWDKPYLRQIKRYKSRANRISWYISHLNGIKIPDNYN
jgi:hypothetical protein